MPPIHNIDFSDCVGQDYDGPVPTENICSKPDLQTHGISVCRIKSWQQLVTGFLKRIQLLLLLRPFNWCLRSYKLAWPTLFIVVLIRQNENIHFDVTALWRSLRVNRALCVRPSGYHYSSFKFNWTWKTRQTNLFEASGKMLCKVQHKPRE